MPSSSKKHSKAGSKLSRVDQSASPQNPPSLPTLKESEISKEDLLHSLENAASKYPSLIGKSALIGCVTDVEPLSKGCKLWLSESSMVASSIAPGSTVSVSLAPREFSSRTSLCSLADECAKHFGIRCINGMVNDLGNYFALATVFPSCKVSKDGVRLSSSLSCTLGCPSSGRIVLIYPIQCQSDVYASGNDKLRGTSVDSLSLFHCKELYLDLVSSKSVFAENGNMHSGGNFSGQRTHGQSENGKVLSPITPLRTQSKLAFAVDSQLSSPRCEESISSSRNPYETSFDSFDIAKVLGDESMRKLLQACTTSWLHSRTLLRGNFVTIPLLSKICIFQVVRASGSSLSCIDQDFTVAFRQDLFPHAPNVMDHTDDAFSVDHKTAVHLLSPVNSTLETPLSTGLSCPELEHEDMKTDEGDEAIELGGLTKEYAVLRDIIISSSKHTLSSLGLRPTKGVLLHGPPGTGKTSMTKKCVRDNGVNLFVVNGPEIVRQYYGESEQALHEVFDSASQATPAVVFIDELDAIAPARRDGGEELSQRMVATLLNLMDGINRTDGLLVIAATNRPDSIDPALRRPGRLDREIEIGVPSPKQRYEILLALLSKMAHSLSEIQVQQLAMGAHGFVGADLAALCNEAALFCLRRHIDLKKKYVDLDSKRRSILFDTRYKATLEGSYCSEDATDVLSSDSLDSVCSSTTDLPISSVIQNEVDSKVIEVCVAEEDTLRVAFEDFKKSKMKVRPSAMREVILEVPKVSWEDVGGQKEVKTQLMEAVEWSQKRQDAFKRIGTRPPTSILMFGPPGCSKTLLARAVASEAGLNFLAVKGPELFSKWVGESQKAVRSLFIKARANSPSIIFFDEIDSLAVIRGKESDDFSVADRVVNQLLVELDGLQQRTNVTVIAATNRPDKIDPALLRPGRFDRIVYVGPPSEADREAIFRIHLRKMPCNCDVCVKELALLTEGCTGADISLICSGAALSAIEESFDAMEIRMEHLKTAIKQARPSEIQSYEDLSVKFQRLVQSSVKSDGLGDQPLSRRSTWKRFWTVMKSIVLFFYQFPAGLARWKPYSQRVKINLFEGVWPH